MREGSIARPIQGVIFSALLVMLVWLPQAGLAQNAFLGTGGETTAETITEIPADLTAEQVDGLLARLTDAQIRELLAEELRERTVEQTMTDMSTQEAIDFVELRLQEMAEAISQRVPRWINGIVNIGDRSDEIEKRIASTSGGVQGLILAIALIVAAGIGTAMLITWLTAPWRAWLTTVREPSYWDKVIRSISLGIVEILPIVAFVLATQFIVPFLSDMLGRVGGYFSWIYTAGISYCWGAVIIARRAFSPDSPLLRIAPLDDVDSGYVYRVIRGAAIVGASAWLIAGIFLHIGLGWGPALMTTASGGTAVAGILLYAVLTSIDRIKTATGMVVGQENEGAFSRIVIAVAPWALASYVVVAYLFWLAHFLETGAQHLYGPVGTLIVYISLPIFDRLGREIVYSLLRLQTPMSERFRLVLCDAWRMIIGVSAVVIVLDLWGFNLIALLSSPATPSWVDTAVDVVVTLLITWLIWKLIKAALHQDRKFVAAGEDVDPALAPKATRLDTLTPLFRGILLAFVASIGLMFLLSSLGVDIGPLLASAGIIGIAVGFGAQALVRDIFSGMFFLIDDAFRVGEYIELTEELRGDVESISIRSLQLRHHRGPVITIPFGEMKNITNHTRDWILYKMPFRMEPDTDPQKFKKIVKKVGQEFMEHPEHGHKFFEPLKSQGVYFVDDDSALVFRVKFKCKPRAQFVLRREIYHRLRQVFEENGFKLSRRKVEVVSSGKESVAEESALPDEVMDVVS
ncbi:MAG: mechanosensitive ion channel family protein [Pseudomonadota bacterium]